MNSDSRNAWMGVAMGYLALFISSPAQVPSMINYQGRLLDGTNLYNGPAALQFRLYDAATGGTLLFASTNQAIVVDGLYATRIGEHVTFGNLDAALTHPAVWLELEINGATLAPRERLLAVPYARMVHGLWVGSGGQVVLNPSGGNAVAAGVGRATIGGGETNTIGESSTAATVGGGSLNSISAHATYAVIGGGLDNRIAPWAGASVIAGGMANEISSNAAVSVIAGGEANVVRGAYSTIGGGGQNWIHAGVGTIGGGQNNGIGVNAESATIAGGLRNLIASHAGQATIGGGYWNVVGDGATNATIAGGRENSIGFLAVSATISGGQGNSAESNAVGATIGGGLQNAVRSNSVFSTVSGGAWNVIERYAWYSTIGGGAWNTNSYDADWGAIGGGARNAILVGADYGTIPGGYWNSATNFAFAAGRRAKAFHTGSFVWGDSTDQDVVSSNANEVTFRASGGFKVFTSSDLSTGVRVLPGSGSWTSMSDVNAKEGFEPVNPEEVLRKVATLPIMTWRYKGQPEAIRHMGPTAQDFYAAFGLGDLPAAGITTIDADGVALAAIQALAQRCEALSKENAELRAELRQLYQELNGRLRTLEARPTHDSEGVP